MIHPALDEARRALLGEARRLLAESEGCVRTLQPDEDLGRALAVAHAQLDEGFLLVVVGEFNAGKSAFINALLGPRAARGGRDPDHLAHRPPALRGGGRRARPVATALETIAAPLELLRTLTIVDTPGTNAVLREHEALTRDFVPRADLVLFLTSADRPYTETERAFLEALREWGKKVVVVVNKADLLETAEDRERVLGFVARAGRAHAGQRARGLRRLRPPGAARARVRQRHGARRLRAAGVRSRG